MRKHLLWLYSRKSRQKAAGQRIKNLDELYIYDELITHLYDVITGVPILPTRAVRPPDSTIRPGILKPDELWPHYVQLYRDLYRNPPQSKDEFDKFLSEFDPLIILHDDPDTVDRIGIEETAGYLIDSFNAIAKEYSSKPYKVFITLLDTMERSP